MPRATTRKRTWACISQCATPSCANTQRIGVRLDARSLAAQIDFERFSAALLDAAAAD
jgi:hypothetical protein